ncbi:uncharacterized protein VTP21DRAFT_6309 [Calcarisporiella thermophila]|uniref:uncharacterized protein n=1 Tax=Calcarisporiella thermophila TaxID=911321 RepID=UPI003744511E
MKMTGHRHIILRIQVTPSLSIHPLHHAFPLAPLYSSFSFFICAGTHDLFSILFVFVLNTYTPGNMIRISDWTLRTYLFYFIWFVIHGGLFVYGFFKQKLDSELQQLNDIGFSVWTSRGAGLALAFDLAFILLPVCRNLLRMLRWTRLKRFVDLDENIWLHKVTAWTMLFFTSIHVTAHYINFYTLDAVLRRLPALSIHYSTWGGTTGHLMLLCMLLIYTTATPEIRRTSFESFWYTHHLAFFFLLLAMLHGYGCFVKTGTGECRGYNSWQFIIVSYSLYVIERVIRLVRSRRETYISKVVAHPGNVIELQMKKPSMRYKVGQYMFLNVPEVSYFEWHPFTITSSPDEDYISVHIRQAGDWTRKLAERLGYQTVFKGSEEVLALRPGALSLPQIRIDGPFGAPSEDVFDNEVAILIGTGIGVTPFASILKHIWIRHQKGQSFKLQRVEFFWICRDTSAFEWFQQLLRHVEEATFYLKFLGIHIYLTGKLPEETVYNLMINDVSLPQDPVTDLESRTHYGRPNFALTFRHMKVAIASGNYLPGLHQGSKVKVGVYYCGPPALARQLKRECKEACDKAVQFVLHKEHF